MLESAIPRRPDPRFRVKGFRPARKCALEQGPHVHLGDAQRTLKGKGETEFEESWDTNGHRIIHRRCYLRSNNFPVEPAFNSCCHILAA